MLFLCDEDNNVGVNSDVDDDAIVDAADVVQNVELISMFSTSRYIDISCRC